MTVRAARPTRPTGSGPAGLPWPDTRPPQFDRASRPTRERTNPAWTRRDAAAPTPRLAPVSRTRRRHGRRQVRAERWTRRPGPATPIRWGHRPRQRGHFGVVWPHETEFVGEEPPAAIHKPRTKRRLARTGPRRQQHHMPTPFDGRRVQHQPGVSTQSDRKIQPPLEHRERLGCWKVGLRRASVDHEPNVS